MSKTRDHKIESEKIKARSKEIQTQMRNMEYTFEVEHVRPLKYFVSYELGAGGIKYNLDNMLNREEFREALSMGFYEIENEIENYLEPDIIKYGQFVESTGGFTRLTITKKDGQVLVGKYNFTNEPFFKAKGFMKAALKIIGADLNV